MVLSTTAPAVVRGVLPWLDPELQIGASSRRLGTVSRLAHFMRPQSTSSWCWADRYCLV